MKKISKYFSPPFVLSFFILIKKYRRMEDLFIIFIYPSIHLTTLKLRKALRANGDGKTILNLKSRIIFLLSFSFSSYATGTNDIHLTVTNTHKSTMPFAIIIEKTDSCVMKELVTTIQKDLIFTEQFTPKIDTINDHSSQKQLAQKIKKCASLNIPLALYIHTEPDSTISYRLYDTLQGTPLSGKKYRPHSSVVRGWGHAIADDVVKTLTRNNGFFSSRIVYCKEHKAKDNTITKHIYLADYDGSNEELLVNSETINVAPRWNNDMNNPAIYYSQYTDTNAQLVAVDMHKNKKIASNLDGITMLVNFSPDGQESLFCASKGKGNCQIFHQTKDVLRNLTNNSGNNFSPFFIDKDRIGFCSDAQTKSPQIYIGDLHTGHLQRITKGGYCTSPSYCPKTNQIVYNMKVKNVMQIYTYDCASKKHTQLTYGSENKHDPSWAPDGTHIMFTKEYQGNSQIVSLNLTTSKIHYLTSKKDHCSYPYWSPQYKVFPTVIT